MSDILQNEDNPFMKMSRDDFLNFLDKEHLTYEETPCEGYILFEDTIKIGEHTSYSSTMLETRVNAKSFSSQDLTGAT